MPERLKFAVDVPNFGEYADPHLIVEMAREAEEAGWDGFSLWDHILYFSGNPVADPWVLLTAVAAATERISLMSMVTPVPRRRPWVLARQCVTLDQLSGGRLILGVGIGNPPGPEFGAFGEPTDDRLRADLLDEGLEILAGMWSGEPFSFEGEHYRIEEHAFQPTPVQTPRIPIWVAGMWPNRRPFRRAARWDGVVPIAVENGEPRSTTTAELADLLEYTGEHRAGDGAFDVTVSAWLPPDEVEAAEQVAEFAAAGATWIRVVAGYGQPIDDVRARVRRGPPV